MNHRKKPERRTFLQDRFEILIKRQKNGKATFSELTELDYIVNKDPEIRNRILREDMLMEGTDDFNEPVSGLEAENNDPVQLVKNRGLLHRIKSFITRIFNSPVSFIKAGFAYRVVVV